MSKQEPAASSTSVSSPSAASSSAQVTAMNDAGLAEADFARLSDVFARHLSTASGGMAFAVYRGGEPVVRLYGGTTSRCQAGQQPSAAWTPETLAVLFSGTKGLVATVAAILVDQGRLDVRAPVTEYWPEFSAGGKENVRVFHLLSHSVGLPYVDPEPEGEWGFLDNAANATALAAQVPLWIPGEKVAYHASTYGNLMNEVFLRVTGKSAGMLISELLATPLGLDVWLGLPEEQDDRVAATFKADDYAISTFLKDPERRKIVDRMYRAMLLTEKDVFNSVEMRRAEMAGGGAIGSADAMASLYSRIVDPGSGLVSASTLRDATQTWSEGLDTINDRPLRFGLGYELDDPIGTYGPVRPAFGHSGAGGGLHGAWPERGFGFSFLTNEMLAENKDSRVKDLLAVLADIDL
ncbi:serine hydrolase domain-containing protein [Saxibacter everestensis]|uniref:Serine hydrolase domain-containing protein n=1 Tax=Saxibacter everestensis TaxID=2909229 RepID=A0ABY8QVV5_9MICO|nr:serine hydrolase domain-containing protein [Brevibacteriaceae bacterium ZFBP1038]